MGRRPGGVNCARVQQRVLSARVIHDNLRPYKGVTFYKRTGKWEANLWFENKQHYLGASFSALEAARAYDKGILFTRSSTEQLNFDRNEYKEDMHKMRGMSFMKYRQYLRDTSKKANCVLINKSSKGILIDANGKWEVKYCPKNLQKSKYVLVGWFDTEEEALRAYNKTALQYGDERATVRSFFTKNTGYARVSSTTKVDSDITFENTERAISIIHLSSNKDSSHSSNEGLVQEEEVTSSSHRGVICLEGAIDASKYESSVSMEDYVQDDENDDAEDHDATLNFSVIPQETDPSSLSNSDEAEGTHQGTIVSSYGSKGMVQMNYATYGLSNIPEEKDPSNPSDTDPREEAHRDGMVPFYESSGMLQENHLHTWGPSDFEHSHNQQDGCFLTVLDYMVFMIIYRMRQEWYDHLQILELLNLIQFMEANRALECVDGEITRFNFFPEVTPFDFSPEVTTFDFFPANPLSTDIQSVSELSHLKLEGPFDIQLSL